MSTIDLIQSVVLLVLLIFVVGLTRQIAFFVRPTPEKRADQYGPPVGVSLPGELLDDGEAAALHGLVDHADARKGVLLIVNELCDPCEDWLNMLTAGQRSIPVAVMTKNPRPEFVARLEAACDLVINDDDRNRLQAANLIATPFALQLDQRLRVQSKQLGGDPAEILGVSPPSGPGRSSNGTAHQRELEVVSVVPERETRS